MRSIALALVLSSCVHGPQRIYVDAHRAPDVALAAQTLAQATRFEYSLIYSPPWRRLGPDDIAIVDVDTMSLGDGPRGSIVVGQAGHCDQGHCIQLAAQYLDLADTAERQRVILHELLHTQGVAHITSTPAVMCPGDDLPCASKHLTAADVAAYSP